MSHITIVPAKGPVTVRAAGQVIATSTNALELREGSSPPVIYVPRADVQAAFIEPSARTSTCPWKGQASYYAIRVGDTLMKDAIWSYEAPKADVAAIAGHMAFYTDRVEVSVSA
jgi:uncharacterized protein (DUF427 family)